MSEHGFELKREQEIPELGCLARIYRHGPTGAELLSVACDDENKAFGITFRTPPRDSTGVAHILEHSVLCGSRKFPVKEPFVELLKGSLQTFLNAFTFPDKTCYPVASQNVRDLYNLVDVYLDAVFFPLLTRHTFEQEAWHYELERAEDPLAYKGVVFNEMKGAYSSPDSLLAEWSQRSLFPDTTYGLDSGGDPAHIPNLTWEQLTAFHRMHYRPSNALVFFYGDDDPEERLRFLGEWFRALEEGPVDLEIPLQPRLSTPRRVERAYHAGDGPAKSFMTVNWLLCESHEVETSLALQVLTHILVGTPASPLRKALIESGLGEDLAGIGIETQLRQLYFSTGLKGFAPGGGGRVEALILDTLKDLAARGIDLKTVSASLNTIEFQLREMNTGGFPRGLALMLGALSSWLYGGDPLAPLRFEAPLAALRRSAAAGGCFEALIRAHLLENPHRTTVVLDPDPTLGPREEASEKARLAEARKKLSDQGLAGLIAGTRELKERQGRPDSPEALAAIPSLRVSDMDPLVKRVPTDAFDAAGARLLYHDLATRGILYVDAGLSLKALPAELLPFTRLLGRALTGMGTLDEDYVSLSQRIGLLTGGISARSLVATVRGTPDATAWLVVRGKALTDRAGDLAALLRDMLLKVRLDNRERFKQILLEEKADLEARLLPEGSAYVRRRACAGLREADWAAEQIEGVSYLLFLQQLEKKVEADWPGVLEGLQAVKRALVRREGLVLNATIERGSWPRCEPVLRELIEAIPSTHRDVSGWRPAAALREGLAIPSKVNYVGLAADLYGSGYRLHGSVFAVLKHLRTVWLWDRVRVQGGAYGGSCGFDPLSGVFHFTSYRDPNLEATLEIYRATGAYLRRLRPGAEEIARSVIGAIGELDAHQLPDAKGLSAMSRHLCGQTDEVRQRLRDELLSAEAGHFAAFGDALDSAVAGGREVAMGDAGRLTAAGYTQITRLLGTLP
jgi:presequence protease